MVTEWITPMQWDNAGAEPSDVLKEEGFKAKYKPAADTFNYFFNKEYRCIKQLQENADRLQKNFDNRIVTATRIDNTADGAGNIVCNYTATVDGITELHNGMEIIIIPDQSSTFTSNTQTINIITLNINGLGAVPVRQPLSFTTFVATSPTRSGFLYANTPCRLMYHKNYTSGGIWLMADKQKTSAQDLYGSVPIKSGGTGADTAEAARENLGLGYVAIESIVPVAKGGTGATTAEGARTKLGLGSAATKSSTSTVSEGSAALVTSGGVHDAMAAFEGVKVQTVSGSYMVYNNKATAQQITLLEGKTYRDIIGLAGKAEISFTVNNNRYTTSVNFGGIPNKTSHLFDVSFMKNYYEGHFHPVGICFCIGFLSGLSANNVEICDISNGTMRTENIEIVVSNLTIYYK